jgi:hypothetical protein
MREPQSGMTNCEVNSRIAFQIWSIGWWWLAAQSVEPAMRT